MAGVFSTEATFHSSIPTRACQCLSSLDLSDGSSLVNAHATSTGLKHTRMPIGTTNNPQ
jgi:hypothetical protein